MRSLLALAAAAAAVTTAASPAATSLGSSDFQTAVLGRPELWIVDFYAPVRAIPHGVCCCRTTPLLLARRQRQPDPAVPARLVSPRRSGALTARRWRPTLTRRPLG